MPLQKRRVLLPEISAILLFVVVCLIATYITESLVGTGYQGSSSTQESFEYFIVYIVATAAVTLVILFLARKNRGGFIRTIFLGVSVYVIFFVSLLISDIVYAFQYYLVTLYNLPVQEVGTSMLLNFYLLWIGTPAVLGYVLFTENNWVATNITGIMLAIGIGAIWSLYLGVWFALALLVILAVYDYVSVFKTKHMVTLARVAMDEKIPMLFAFPGKRGFDLNQVSMDDREGLDAILLGFGDIAIPSVMVVSSAIYGMSRSILYLLLPMLGGIVGLVLLLFFVKQRPAPGLPTINSGVIAGFLLAFAITVL